MKKKINLNFIRKLEKHDGPTFSRITEYPLGHEGKYNEKIMDTIKKPQKLIEASQPAQFQIHHRHNEFLLYTELTRKFIFSQIILVFT